MKAEDGAANPKNFILFPALLILSLLLSACLATVTPPSPFVLKVAGSTSMGPLLAELAAAYSADHPHITVDIQGGGSQLGQTLAAAGQVDLGLVSWPASNLPENLRPIPIARDAIAIILHPENKIEGLSLLELQTVFSGRLLNWREVNGAAGPIQVVSREEGSGTRAAFEKLVMGELPVTPTAVVLPNSQAVVDFVQTHPNAVGYVSLAFVSNQVYPVPLEQIPATRETLASGVYPLSRELVLLVPKQTSPGVEAFINFTLSPAGQALLETRWGRVK